MSGPYFQKEPWPNFSLEGTIYDLSHLGEWQVTVEDQSGARRLIVVTFGDHCFTRPVEDGDSADLHYPNCSRNPGCFSLERYICSLDIARHIETASAGKVWLLQGHSCAVIPITNALGQPVEYGIIFSLDRVKGIEGVDLHMRVKSAYPFTKKRPTTYGSTRFRVLVDLRMRNKYPGLNTSQHRRW